MKDLTGQRFGRLVAVRQTDMRKNGFIVWECQCDCGNTVYVKRGALTCGNTKSCGCLNAEQRRANGKDLSGQRFGRLTAVRPTDMRQGGAVVWECLCDCGVTTLVRSIALQSGNTRSCGCLKDENADQMHRLELWANGREPGDAAGKQVRKNNTSGYVGVSYNTKTEKYVVGIRFQGKDNYLGSYKDIHDAVDARKKAEALIWEEGQSFCARWKEKADADLAWGKENPIRIRVRKDAQKRHFVVFLPEL